MSQIVQFDHPGTVQQLLNLAKLVDQQQTNKTKQVDTVISDNEYKIISENRKKQEQIHKKMKRMKKIDINNNNNKNVIIKYHELFVVD